MKWRHCWEPKHLFDDCCMIFPNNFWWPWELNILIRYLSDLFDYFSVALPLLILSFLNVLAQVISVRITTCYSSFKLKLSERFEWFCNYGQFLGYEKLTVLCHIYMSDSTSLIDSIQCTFSSFYYTIRILFCLGFYSVWQILAVLKIINFFSFWAQTLRLIR